MCPLQNLDWFEPATQQHHTWSSGFDRLICIEESKLQFIRCLKQNICHHVPQSPDRIALIQQDIRQLSQTLQLRLGMLAMDRPQAWFRHSPPTERGPFPAAIHEEPVFSRFDEARASSIRHYLPELWRSRQTNCEDYDPGASLWGRLLGLNRTLHRINQLPPPFADLCLDELPEALPDELMSPALMSFGSQIAQRMRSSMQDLEACYQLLWTRSESFLYAIHIQYLSKKARHQQDDHEEQQRTRRSERRSVQSVLQEALRFMSFHSLPDISSLRQRYRNMAQQMHPDRGGTAEHFQLLSRHYEQILRHVQSEITWR